MEPKKKGGVVTSEFWFGAGIAGTIISMPDLSWAACLALGLISASYGYYRMKEKSA